MSVKERFIWLLRIHEISREKFGRDADYNPNTITSFVEAQILADSSPQEVAQAESLVTKLLLREIKRMRDDMKDSNPGLVDKYGLDELLEDVE